MSLDYRTKFFDDQLRFGSGSNINADDVPNGNTNFWLTNILQPISGSKIFADEITIGTSGSSFATPRITGVLDLVNHNVVNVTDPVNNQDATTKYYTDTVSGSIGNDLHSYGYTTKQYVDTVSGSIGQDLNHQTLELYGHVDTVSGSIGSDLHSYGYTTKTYTDTVSGSIGQDLNHQILGARAYTDIVSGSISSGLTLQHVTNNGNITTDSVTAEKFTALVSGSSFSNTRFTAVVDLVNHKIVNVTYPTDDEDAATKKYVDDNATSGSVGTLDDVCENGSTTDVAITLETSGSAFASSRITGTLDLVNNYVTNVLDPINDQDVATKKYVDDNAGGGAIGSVMNQKYKIVVTAGIEVPLSGSTSCTNVYVQAFYENIGYIAVGGSGVDATQGMGSGSGVILSAGDDISIPIDNLASVFIDSTVSGEGVRFSFVS